MTQFARIFVERGAQLAVDGGTITNISGHAWGSIHLDGDPAQNQAYNASTGFSTYQGVVKITNGGTLSKSGTAITNYTVFGAGTYSVEWGSTGGIVIADSANFIDNARDVEFIAYNKPSASYFRNSRFITTGTIGSSLLPFAHVSLYNVSNVKFVGCTFEYTAGTTYGVRGMGLFSIDASYKVDKLCGSSGTACAQPTLFKNLDFGIYVGNVNPLHTISVKNCRFETNTTGAYVHNMFYALFDQNYFSNGPDALASGLYLHQCKYYNVKNNLFRRQSLDIKTGFGVIAYDSKEGAHEIYHNKFGNLWVGINATGNNAGPFNTETGLKMNCNEFSFSSSGESESAITSQYDIALTGSGTGLNMPSVKKVQGLAANPAATDLVRNIYVGSCGNSNKWYIAPSSTLTIDHGCSASSVTNPTPQPSCSGTLLTVSAFSIAYNSSHCPENPPSSGGNATDPGERIANINTRISELKDLGAGADPFELQSAVSSKLNYFLLDTLPESLDTISEVLEENPGDMTDADLQLVFAKLRERDYTTAASLTSSLQDRDDWKDFLETARDIYQEPDQVYSILANEDYFNFLTELSVSEDTDGKGAAQSILKFVSGTDYLVLYEVPEEEIEERHSRKIDTLNSVTERIKDQVRVFPNPAQNEVTISYVSKEDAEAQVNVKDLLGKTIYTNFISKGTPLVVPLSELSNGIYILSLSKNKEIVYKMKLVKQE